MKVYFDDKGRFKDNSGYGNLSRNFAKALVENGCEVVFDKKISKSWPDTISEKKIQEIEDSSIYGDVSSCDIALTISPPVKRVHEGIPNIIYTQNALGGIKKSWGEICSYYDSVIVPGFFDEKFFKPWNENTFVCPQIINNNIFKDRGKWRKEGSNKFTFIFIGSFSYRKGVDLLLESFCEYSKLNSNSSKLIMICPGAKNINYLLSKIRDHNPYADIDFHLEDYSQEWICRFINQSDVFVTLSRGEGWCMPVFESILAEKPIILPASTAMGESTPNGSLIKLPVFEKRIEDVDDYFGNGFKKQYAENLTVSYDVAIADVIGGFIEMEKNYCKYKNNSIDSRKFVLNTYSHEAVGKTLKCLLERALIS